jgi:hypothetical protein
MNPAYMNELISEEPVILSGFNQKRAVGTDSDQINSIFYIAVHHQRYRNNHGNPEQDIGCGITDHRTGTFSIFPGKNFWSGPENLFFIWRNRDNSLRSKNSRFSIRAKKSLAHKRQPGFIFFIFRRNFYYGLPLFFSPFS